MRENKLIPPVIKWTGSKRPVAYQLAQLFPPSTRYIDPFVGGGAILPFFQNKPAIVGDIIPELINLWNLIKENPKLVKVEYKNRWSKLQLEGYQTYYSIRDSFNATKDPMDFLFLSRTCVNGLIRYNKKGEFNNSLHHTRPGIHPERLNKIIDDWSVWIKDVSFYNQDYRETLSIVKDGDMVFLDPPYVGTHSRYIPNDFDYSVFYKELGKLNDRNIKWMLTLDGEAGNRLYDSKIPDDLFKISFQVSTGKSPFNKVMNNRQDRILESVYLNFEPTPEMFNPVIQKVTQPIRVFPQQ